MVEKLCSTRIDAEGLDLEGDLDDTVENGEHEINDGDFGEGDTIRLKVKVCQEYAQRREQISIATFEMIEKLTNSLSLAGRGTYSQMCLTRITEKLEREVG